MTERSSVVPEPATDVAATEASFEDFFESQHRTLFRRMCLVTDSSVRRRTRACCS